MSTMISANKRRILMRHTMMLRSRFRPVGPPYWGPTSRFYDFHIGVGGAGMADHNPRKQAVTSPFARAIEIAGTQTPV